VGSHGNSQIKQLAIIPLVYRAWLISGQVGCIGWFLLAIVLVLLTGQVVWVKGFVVAVFSRLCLLLGICYDSRGGPVFVCLFWM